MEQPSSAHLSRLLAALHDLAPLCRAHARESEVSARLADVVAREMVARGLLRGWIPASCGGWELSLPDALQLYRAAARVDGSLGWSVMIGAGGGLFAGYMAADAAREVFARPDAVVAGSGVPSGSAVKVPGGYQVSAGRWRYASGAAYATVFTANCVVALEPAAAPSSAAAPSAGSTFVRAMCFSPGQVRVLQSWDAVGMRATGSDEFTVENVFVREQDSFSVLADAPRELGPLYALPFGVLTELPVASVALGVAARALEEFASFARQQRQAGGGGHASAALAEDRAVQAAFARAQATVEFARAGVDALASQAWAAAVAKRALGAEERARITAGACTALGLLCPAVLELVGLAGMAGILSDSAFARAWRDLQTVAAHVSVSPRGLPEAGRALLLAE
jgi:alkylation response protein AidB-like acyl-CoA dehydrogenase